MLGWMSFGLCMLLIGVAGSKLSRYGDAISEKTGLGGSWVGFVLLASVTSLPELATGVSAVTVARAPDIAVGDALGSCVFNLVIIVMLDVLHGPESLYARASQGHILSAAFGIMLIGFIGFNILLSAAGMTFAVGHIGASSIIILLLYAVAVRTVFRYERGRLEAYVEAEPEAYRHLSLREVLLRYALAACVVIVAGVWLPFVAKDLALTMQWQTSFVGTLFVALATSVPEIVVTVTALRLGALDMAIASLFGSNLFDAAIVCIDDLLFTSGPLLASVSSTHVVSALSAVMMSGVAIVGLLYRPRRRVFKLIGWTSLLLFCLYLGNTFVVYLLDGR